MNKRQRKKLYKKMKDGKVKCTCPIIEGVNCSYYQDGFWIHDYYEVCTLCGQEYQGYNG